MDQQSYGYTPGHDPNQHQGNGMAVAGLVLGILGLILCWIPFLGWILALLGVIFGALGMGKAKKIGGKGNGMAIAGLVTGALGLLLGIVLFVLAMMAVKKVEREFERELERDLRRNRYNQLEIPQMRSDDVASVTMPTPDRG